MVILEQKRQHLYTFYPSHPWVRMTQNVLFILLSCEFSKYQSVSNVTRNVITFLYKKNVYIVDHVLGSFSNFVDE